MEATKIQTTEQPLLKRSMVVYRIAYEGATPARTAIVQSLSTKEKGTVVVTNVHTINGEQAAYVHCNVYKDAAVAKAVERANMLAKQSPKAETAESA
jgi:ribosomal protein S24E